MSNPQPCWRCWPKTKKSHPKCGCVKPSWHVRQRENLNKTRNQSNSRHRLDKLWENATNQRWHISQILVFSTGILEYGKVSYRHFPIIPSSKKSCKKSLNNLPGIGNTRKMAISRFLVPILKITSIVAWPIFKLLVLWLDKSRWRMGLNPKPKKERKMEHVSMANLCNAPVLRSGTGSWVLSG